MISQHSFHSVGIVGTGRMGANMARRLNECGYRIAALYDTNRQTAEQLAQELDSTAYTSLAQVTAQCGVIITVVPDDAAMTDIYEDPEDNLLMGAQGRLFLNCATISPEVHIHLHALAQQADASMLEVPMASSIPQAREGKLYLMVAGDKAVYDQAKPLLDNLASSIIFTGAPGTAAKMKALVNMVMNINTAGLAEGLGLADALDLDLEMVRQVFSQTGANSRVLETDGDDMQHREHEAYFTAEHAAKDSGIALALACNAGLNLPVATATWQQYEVMKRSGLGQLDKSGVSELTFKDRQPQL